jgi:hypothetical protein
MLNDVVNSFTNSTLGDECNDYYLIGLSVATGLMAVVSECMSLSKCGGESNGIIDAIKNCLKNSKKEYIDDKKDISDNNV